MTNEFDPASHIDETVTIRGTAYDARAGAIVELDDSTPIYIAGLSSWEQGFDGKPIEVTGLLRRRQPRAPRVPSGGPQSHGLVGETFVLENASWSLVS